MKSISFENLLYPLIGGLAMTAISAIAVHAIGWMPLYYSARLIVIPAFVAIFICAMYSPEIGKNIQKGWIFGLIAVSFYDLSRIPFMMMGWGDFIPSIGNWFLAEEHSNPLIGYAWRYIGNGGGLGIAFMMMLCCFNIRKNLILTGTVYGISVWAGLTLILFMSLQAQSLMFSLNPLSLAGSFTGHLVYGLVLGILVNFNSKSA
jgi:hypothetical protein